MVAKEWRDARWKLLIGAAVALTVGVLIPVDALFQTSYSLFGQPDNVVAPSIEKNEGYLRYLPWSQWFTDASGNLILMLIATLLGAGLVSVEANRNTLLLLLNRPISRERMLLTKYLVNAGSLLVITLLGSGALLITTGALGHPQHAGGVLVSAGLMWLGLLFVLGTALLLSVLLNSTLLSVAGTFLIWATASVLPAFIGQQMAVLYSSQGASPAAFFDALALSSYWTSLPAYSGNGFPALELLVSSVAAAVPLLASLWLFHRKAY